MTQNKQEIEKLTPEQRVQALQQVLNALNLFEVKGAQAELMVQIKNLVVSVANNTILDLQAAQQSALNGKAVEASSVSSAEFSA